MVEANKQPSSAVDDTDNGNVAGILKNAHEGGGQRNVMFDEAEIAAHDATRGQCMPIDDPKTPFHESESDEDDEATGGKNAEAEPVDPELEAHLAEAKAN